VRYRTADELRLVMDFVEVKRGDKFHRYTNRRLNEAAIKHPIKPKHDEVRSMDCIDCHNRATHIYEDPEAAIDQAMANGEIARSIPFAKKIALSALTGSYVDKDAAMTGIDNAVRGFYMRDLDDQKTATSSDVDQLIAKVQLIYNNNIFPFMNVGWNPYPSHIGHSGQGGCFRCHNENMVDDAGVAIPYDCTLCHSILAMDSKTKFQYLLPAEENDPDRKMHEYLQREFLGVDAPVVEEPLSE